VGDIKAMTIEDLEHIFKPQIDEGTTSLYFMLIDSDHRVIMRQESNEIQTLLSLLDNFEYAGSEGRMPRFVK
jgi:hypothetical protein